MKKRVLFINGHLNAGGVEKSLVDILRHLDLEKFEVELLLLEEYGDYINEIPAQIKVRLFDLHNTYGNIFQCLKNCLKQKDWKCLWVRIIFLVAEYFGKDKYKWISKTIVGDKEYDCVVGFRPGIASELAAYSVKSKKKFTWWHHGEFNMNDQQSMDYYDACKQMDQIIVVSNGCANFLQERFPDFAEKMLVIPNMLDIEQIQQKADEYIPFEKKNGIYDIVSVGRLSPEKHLENIIYAAKKITDAGIKDCRWFIVGEGTERGKLEELIKENNLLNQVLLVGSRSNPYPYMKNADWIVHTSYVESQCLVVLEAMALGKVCIVTESIGPKEFAVDGENCILAKPNLESLEESIKTAFNSEKEVESIEKAAIETARMFSAEHVIGRIQELLLM